MISNAVFDDSITNSFVGVASS